jgi:molecular chaperone GrpE (heat shock protein)
MRIFIFIKIIFLSFFIITTAQSEDTYLNKYSETFKKYSEEKKENYIANQNIKELNDKLKETNTQKEKLIKELEEVNTQYSKLDNIKIIQITRSSGLIFFSSIIILVLIILYLSLIISRQRKWRKEFYDENNNKFIGLLPERIAETIDKIEEAYNVLQESNSKQYDNFNKNLQQVVNLIGEVSKNNSDSILKINEQLSSLRKFSDEKNELVKKYQKFYDLSVLKSFIFDIIASIDNLENNITKLENENKSQDSINAIKSAKDRLVILLENENIEVIEPNTDLKFNDPKQTVKCKVIETIKTSDENLVGMISSVIHAGYNGIIGPNNEITLIREAWVNIYSKGNEEEKNNG